MTLIDIFDEVMTAKIFDFGKVIFSSFSTK
jgi:hypothetical protein